MSYYSAVNKEKPTEIEIGSEFVTIRKLDSYSAPKPCRILRRTTDADGTLVGLVLVVGLVYVIKKGALQWE